MSSPVSPIHKRKTNHGRILSQRACQVLFRQRQQQSQQPQHALTAMFNSNQQVPNVSPFDFMSVFPAEISIQIIEKIADIDIPTLRKVCKSWNYLFSDPSSPLSDHFRHVIHRRYNLTVSKANIQNWGRLYLALRRERCHLCPAESVHPFVYAGSRSLSVLFSATNDPPLTLFPLCTSCFWVLLRSPRDPFLPVIDVTALHTVFKGTHMMQLDEKDVRIGYLYSHMPNLHDVHRHCGIQYVLARKFAPEQWLTVRDTPAEDEDEEMIVDFS